MGYFRTPFACILQAIVRHLPILQSSIALHLRLALALEALGMGYFTDSLAVPAAHSHAKAHFLAQQSHCNIGGFRHGLLHMSICQRLPAQLCKAFS